jgi:Cu-Zn family superoxide dismutase
MKLFACTILALGLGGAASAATVSATVMLATPDGAGAAVGTVSISDSPAGAVLTTDLHGLPPGVHGFHVHDKGSCTATADAAGKAVPAGGAGGHMDPAMAGKHEGPDGMGHLGDLPALTVGADGAAKARLIAPHIRSAQALQGHALMIHAGGDNYSDMPAPLGGGGARIACGVIG